MFKIVTDIEKNRLYITFIGHLEGDQARQASEATTIEVAKLSPGFDVINDISEAFPTDSRGLELLTRMQKFLLGQGMRRVIRVTGIRISELQVKRASRDSGYYWIAVPSLEKAESLLDAFTMPEVSAELQEGHPPGRHRRLAVGPDHTVQFTLGPQRLSRIRITNLSAGGCFALIPAEYGDFARVGGILGDFQFEHEDLPATPFTAKIIRISRGLSEVSDCDTGLGIQFLSTSQQFTEWVDAYVITQIEADR